MKSINEARRSANSYAKAKTMTADGYAWNELASKLYRVFKPENTTQDKADYIVDTMLTHCSCPDFESNGVFCKHTLWIGLELEKQDDAANMEWQCAIWEEQNLPMLPTVEETARKMLVAKMEADLTKVQADIDAQGERRTGYLHSQHLAQRAGRLENAIETVNQYRCPADVPPHQFCTVCGIANLHGPRCFADDCPNRITR
jgi:SWIM zinc finger